MKHFRLQLCTDRFGVAVGVGRDDGKVADEQGPIVLGGYAAKQCPVRVQNDFLPLLETVVWEPSPEDQARLIPGRSHSMSAPVG